MSEPFANISEFSYMWDGSETGWILRHTDQTVWLVTISFKGNRPTVKEVARLRTLLSNLRDRPVSEIWQQLQGLAAYSLPNPLSNIEMHGLLEKAKQLGLTATTTLVDQSGYLPINGKGNAVLIEDDELAKEVVKRMIAAGVPVEEIHVD